eukprot:gnl/MRDRNA2_/MRDRNA2_340590_c0_seq1.p1 gnl/MRDRNA2_/MRDRNA2_340590_c0~~gnl/MRDRNA2_/MRDRNA2_340590_c0_seq1.p1  ORF type:complete len:357 (+),score=80.21 gnl/MRDRNA2_/MRDRNA2_340590_c0_seq1:1-1071(+)
MLDMDKLLEATRRIDLAQTLVDKASTAADFVWSVNDELQQDLAIHQAEVATVEADVYVQESRHFVQKISALRPSCSGSRRKANAERNQDRLLEQQVARLTKMLCGFEEKLAVLKDIRQEIAQHRSVSHYDLEDLEDEDAFWHGEVAKSSSSLADASTSMGGPSSSSTSLENEEEGDAVYVRAKKRGVFDLPAKPRPDHIMHLDAVLSIMRKAQVSLGRHQHGLALESLNGEVKAAEILESLNEEVKAAETTFTKAKEAVEKETQLEAGAEGSSNHSGIARVEAVSEGTPSSSSIACPAQQQSQAAGHGAQEQSSLEAQLDGEARYQEVPADGKASSVIDWFVSALNLPLFCCMARK